MSAWRAPDGDVALALVNISDEGVSLNLSPDWQAWGLTGREARWQLDEDARRHPLGPLAGERAVEMAPQEAQVMEWTKE
jgi:hypothetical protein